MKSKMNEICSRSRLADAVMSCVIAVTLLLLNLPMALQAQTLKNEWSFNENGGTTAVDSISGANITVVGGAALGGGALNLPGGSGNYAQFPDGILSTYTNSMTIETWFTDLGGLTWARVWSFGGSTASAVANNANYIDLIPRAGGANNINGGFWTEFNHSGVKDVAYPIAASAAADRTPVKTGVPVYATMVYDGPSQIARLYFNGVQVAQATIAFKPSDLGVARFNRLGLDQYNDAPFNGTVDEMRIWSGTVSQRYISASLAAGPGVVINNLTPTSASLTAGPALVLTETEPALVTVQLPQTGSSNLLATADATNWVSGNPSVLTVTSNGVINAVGLGTTTVSAVIAGIPVTSGNITVTPQVLQHEWSFNESSGTTAADSVGGAAVTLQGTTSLGGGVLTLPGGAGNFAQFPNGILASNNSITIETWLTDNGGQTWSRAWSFGGSVTVAGNLIQNNYIDLIPHSGGGSLWTEFKSGIPALTTYDIANAGNQSLPTSRETYVTVTYNAQNQTCIMYSNGVVAGTLTGVAISPASLGNAMNNYIGLDQWNDAIFKGTFDEMRIWDGAATPTYMLLAAAAGPGVVITNLTPQSLSVSAATTSMIGSQTQQATVQGSFLQVANLTLTSVATNWTSSDPSVLTVSSSGLITAQSGGTATVSATVNGVTATSATITVSATAPTITQGPASQTNVMGDNVSFTVQAQGGSLSYQWSLNTAPIAGATNNTLVLTNVQSSQAGTYSVLVSNTISTASASAALVVESPILQHDWSFNESGGTTAADSISSSNITLLGGTSLGGGVLTLPGGAGNYAQFPNGILSTYSNSITIETWLTDNGGLTWARPWSFGGSTAGTNSNFSQSNYIDLIPTAGSSHGINGGLWMEFNHNGNIDGYISTPLPKATEEYVTVTYQVWTRSAQLYLNGVQVATATNINFSPADLGFTYNNFIGLDQWNDAIFNGTFDEMRIWNGAVTPLYEMLSAAAGPSVVITNTTPQAVSITVNTSPVVGQTQTATASADFAQISSVPVTTLATNWVSSNPGVVTVTSNGIVTAIAHGTATISATFDGIVGTSPTITVSASVPVITQEPAASLTLLVGGTLQASVASVGDAPFTYYWFANGNPTPISASSSPTLTVPNLQLSDAGSYVCVVSNQVGTATSSTLNLTVLTPTTYQQAMLSLNPGGFWPLNETSGTIAYDVIGGNNGTYAGTYAQGQAGPPNAFFGGAPAAVFDGASGHVVIPGASLNFTNAVTVMAWVNILSAPTFDGLFGRGDTSWRLSINPNGQAGGNDDTSAADATDPITSPGIYDGNWHLVAYAYNGTPGQANNGALYVDGALVANNTVATNVAGNNLDAWIGGSPDYPNRFLPAYIADAAVFAQALSATQIQGIYNGVAVAGPQTITISRSGANVILNWQTGALLEANNLLGPWTTNSAAVPGYTVPATNAAKFFKLLVPSSN